MKDHIMPAASNAATAGLTIKGLRKNYGKVQVVKGLDLDIQPGEFLVLLGPSGCGKSTALRIIAGLEQADSGTIALGGRDITNVLPKERDIAMVFQSYALYPHKTVAENIGFPLKVRGVDAKVAQAAILDAARQVELVPLLGRYPRELSGGQRQRVALACAMVRRPLAFLMDEPLSNLDAKLRGCMRAELKRMQYDLGITTVYVTHDQVEAMTLAHRVAILNDGVVQQIGTPREIYGNPANVFVAGFLGSPPMNFLPGGIRSNTFGHGATQIRLAGNTPDFKAVLGFPPEDAQICEPGTGRFDARVYASELIGDHTLVTVNLDGSHIVMKMPKEFEADFDKTVGIRFAGSAGYLFDADTGMRIAASIAQ